LLTFGSFRRFFTSLNLLLNHPEGNESLFVDDFSYFDSTVFFFFKTPLLIPFWSPRPAWLLVLALSESLFLQIRISSSLPIFLPVFKGSDTFSFYGAF